MNVSHHSTRSGRHHETCRFVVTDGCPLIVRRVYRLIRRSGLDAFNARTVVIDLLYVGHFATDLVDHHVPIEAVS